jgi:hypothetical protein
MMRGGQSASVSPIVRVMRPSSCTKRRRARADEVLRIERAFARFVGYQLDGPHQPDAACLADQRMIGKGLQARLECRNQLGGFADDVVARIDLERLQRDRRREWMAAIEMREGEPLKLFAAGLDQLSISVAKRGAPQTCHALDIGSPAIVEHVDAFAADDDRGVRCRESAQVRYKGGSGSRRRGSLSQQAGA